jgi:hypothetical protein
LADAPERRESVVAGRPLPPRREPGADGPLTAGRPLPPRRDGASGDDAPRASTNRQAASPPTARPSERARPAKPDARPMRVVYGVGALAAVSVIAVGMVQPDYGNAGDSGNSSGSDDVNVSLDPGYASFDGATPSPNVVVQHVIEYVQLAPGQTPPPDSIVIGASALPSTDGIATPGSSPDDASAPPTRAPRATKPGQTSATPTPTRSSKPGNPQTTPKPTPHATAPTSQPTSQPTPRPTPQPTPKPTPQPTPKPTPQATPRPTPTPTATSRQSGKG